MRMPLSALAVTTVRSSKAMAVQNIPVVTLELELSLPFVEIPNTRLAAPSTRDDEGPARRDIERTDVVCVSDEQPLSIVAGVPARCLSLDDGVLSARDDQTIGVFFIRWKVCE